VVEAKSLAIPKQQLDAITTTPSKREHRTRRGLLAKRRLHQRHQAIDPLAHIRHTAGEIDANICAWRNHASSTERISAFKTSGAILASTFKPRPPLQPISIRMGRAARFAVGLSTGAGRSASSLDGVEINATGRK